MRSKKTLTELRDVGTLFQYLYMNETHSVIAYNEIDVPLQVTMDEDGRTWMRNMNFDHPAHLKVLDVSEWLAVVDQLKHRPSKEALKLNNHATAWDDICLVVDLNFAADKNKGN